MTLESSITELNASVQTLIKVISGLDAPIIKPKAVKAAKAAPVKQAKPTIPVASVEADTEDSFPTLTELVAEMKVISDRSVLSNLLEKFACKTASQIPEDRRTAFIEAIHLELQQGAA